MSSIIPEDAPIATPNIFGFFRYFWKISPFNCGKKPLRIFFLFFSLASFLAMIFRAWWMFYMVDAPILSFGWSERNLYAFISMESFSCVIALYFMTSKGTLKRFEQGIGMLKKMRINPYYEKYDEYSALRKKTFLLKVPIPIFFIGCSGFLVYKKLVIFGSNRKIRNPDTLIRNPEVGPGNPESGSRTREFGIRKSDPGIRNPEVGPGNPESGSRTRESGIRKSDPGIRTRKSRPGNPDPGIRTRESGPWNPDLEIRNSGIRTQESGLRIPESGPGNPEVGPGNPDPKIRNPEVGPGNPESGIRTQKYGIRDSQSSWYYYVDAGIMILCAYVNFIYLPVHGIMQNALAREFHVFNDELKNASENKELVNPQILQKFADRQVKLFEITNRITERLHGFMSSAPFLTFTALTNVTYLVTNLREGVPTYYYVCMIGMMICCIIISSNLLYPAAFVQETMLHTSTVLMNDPFLHHSQDPKIYSTYRIMVDRSQKNRSVNLVIQIFSVNRKNIERAYFVITNIVLVMSVLQKILVS
ncbi:unnamed protein product [Caenorhabditis nigoni]